MFTAPCSEVIVNSIWAGDLAEDKIPYSCVTAPDYVLVTFTGFAFEPSHPGDMAPKSEVIQMYRYFILLTYLRQVNILLFDNHQNTSAFKKIKILLKFPLDKIEHMCYNNFEPFHTTSLFTGLKYYRRRYLEKRMCGGS